MQHTTIAVDVAKWVFEIGMSQRPGHVDKHYRVSRNQLSIFFANQPPATVVMEACSSSHYWARQFIRFGHDVKLLPPFYVRPYVQRSKTDRTDVKGMLEAGGTVKFVRCRSRQRPSSNSSLSIAQAVLALAN